VIVFRLALKHFLSRPFSSVITLLAIAGSLTLLGTFWTVVENLERVRSDVSSPMVESPGFTVFVDSKLSASETDKLRKNLKVLGNFDAVDVMVPEEAMRSLESQFGETLSKVFGKDSLPTTLRLRFASHWTPTREDLVGLLNRLRAVPGVLDVDEGTLMLDQGSEGTAHRIFSWATALLTVTFLVVALLVSHLIRLAFESLRSDFETLKVLGAPNHIIIGPLLVDGLVLGFLGSILSLGAVGIFIRVLVPKFAATLLPKGIEVLSLSGGAALKLVSLGVFASVVGALVTWPLVAASPKEG
jgi:cell division transport system permease protein